LDPNSKSPLAGCRNKHPPKDNYQPYVGAAETDKVTKVEDTRELTKSRVRNVYKEQMDEVIRLEKEELEREEEIEKKENELKMKTMNQE
jgi:hypothetical protein